jgi:hypothetical protein
VNPSVDSEEILGWHADLTISAAPLPDPEDTIRIGSAFYDSIKQDIGHTADCSDVSEGEDHRNVERIQTIPLFEKRAQRLRIASLSLRPFGK